MAGRPKSGNINFLEPENRYCLDQQAHSLTVKKKKYTHLLHFYLVYVKSMLVGTNIKLKYNTEIKMEKTNSP